MARSNLSLLFLVLFALPLCAAASQATPSASGQNEQQVIESAAIDLNTADAATLERNLSGVGAIKAQAIVNYRENHGAFVSVDELLEVKGIGESLLERNRDKLTVAP